jgi:hypothetical protein
MYCSYVSIGYVGMMLSPHVVAYYYYYYYYLFIYKSLIKPSGLL